MKNFENNTVGLNLNSGHRSVQNVTKPSEVPIYYILMICLHFIQFLKFQILLYWNIHWQFNQWLKCFNGKQVLFVDTCIIEKKLCGLIYWLTSNLVVLFFCKPNECSINFIIVNSLSNESGSKCSHGTRDASRNLKAIGGTFKESSNQHETPHSHLHIVAAEAAVKATMYYLVDAG